MSTLRSRWAAVGAAVAITLGAGGIGLVDATSPQAAATFVPITPCRAIDTRPAFQVGPRSTPLGPGETHPVAATGVAGECSSVPPSATGVVLNVTATDATLPTFLTIWRTGEDRPEASSLNPAPGQPPTPNAVTTGLDDDGRFSIYNFQGTVHVLADVVGYYTDHTHDDRYYTKGQTDERFVWSIDVPLGAIRLGAGMDLTTSQSGGWGIQFPREATGEAHVEFAVPDQHVDGTDVSVRILWSSDAANSTCRFEVELWQVTVARPGSRRRDVGYSTSPPGVFASSRFTLSLGAPPSPGAGDPGSVVMQSLLVTISGQDIRAGDHVHLRIGRDADDLSGNDTCPGAMAVNGVTARPG